MEKDMSPIEPQRNLAKAAQRGEPSYVWRAGQERRLQMVLDGAGECIRGRVLENGCGVGMYVDHLLPYAGEIIGLEVDFERGFEVATSLSSRLDTTSAHVICAAGENLPFPDESFDAILSHEVLEHVQDDQRAVCEMVRILRPGGRMMIFVPNRGYPFETHGIFWKGKYHFGNIPLVNWLPSRIRNRLAPHVRVYNHHSLERLFKNLPVQFIFQTTIFGAYDNIIYRSPRLGGWLRRILQGMEETPFRIFGLSHFWVVEKQAIP
jgi:SAM-dependent methyltransferase